MVQTSEKESKRRLRESIKFGPHYVQLTQGQKRYLAVRVITDWAIAAMALLVLSPLFLIVAIIQKATSPREPVFFLQVRVGQGAQSFKIIKFRTMKDTAPRNVATGDLKSPEQYITKWGRFLRATSIDELPQLINVLRGEMSLIGPRPLVYSERKIRVLRRWYGIYQVKPGITGWAQVNGRDAVNIYDKVYFDREYLQKVSFWFDLKIFLKSIRIVLRREGVIDGKSPPLHPSEKHLERENVH